MEETNRNIEIQEIPSSPREYPKFSVKIVFVVFILALIIVGTFFIISKSGFDAPLNKKPENENTKTSDSSNSSNPLVESLIETPVEKKPFCGDGACSIDEYTKETCKKDCPTELRPPLGNQSLCGNGICEEGEMEEGCLVDCDWEAYGKKMQTENQTTQNNIYEIPTSVVAATKE